ncbi:MAG: hypothetical protein AB1324_04955 [Candidatus Micrarchaeota archaeon]
MAFEAAMGLALGYLLFYVLLSAKGLALAAAAAVLYVRKKEVENRYGKLALFAALAVILFLAIGEFAPAAIDGPALLFPQMCELHWLFPAHFIGSEFKSIQSCYIGAAVFQKSAGACPDHQYQCVHAAVDAGARDCKRARNKDGYGYCIRTLAVESGNHSLCDFTGEHDCYVEVGVSIQDAAACGDGPRYKDECVYNVLERTDAACDNIANRTLREYCLAQKEGIKDGVCLDFELAPHCTAIYGGESVCDVYEGRDVPQRQCIAEAGAVRSSDANKCQDLDTLGSTKTATCIYWVLRTSQDESVCSKSVGSLLRFCNQTREAIMNGSCTDRGSARMPITCVAKYSDDAAICELISDAWSKSACEREVNRSAD